MAAYEVLLLNTAVPQIQAAQAGDTYVCPRDIQITANLDVTGNTTLGDASTDTVLVNGYMGVGGAGASSRSITLSSAALTGTTQEGIRSNFAATSAATSAVRSFVSVPATADAVFTVANLSGFYAANGAKGASSTVTNQHGLYIEDQTQGTNNYGITSIVSSGTNKWNIYASGTAANYFAGQVGIGGTTLVTAANLTISGSGSGSTTGGGALSLFRPNTSAVAGTNFGSIYFTGADTTSNTPTTLAYIRGQASGTHDPGDNPTDLVFAVTADGTEAVYEAMRLNQAGGIVTQPIAGGHTVFNENGVDADFRVESDTNTHALFVDAGNSRVGVGENTPLGTLHTSFSNSGTYSSSSASITTPAGTEFIVQNTSNTTGSGSFLSLRAANGSGTVNYAYMGAVSNAGLHSPEIVFGQRTNATAYAERLRITSVGNISIGGTANRATTVGSAALNIFDGTAPVGTLANGISIYSSSGEAYVMDAAGNATLFSPHDAETNEWIFKSKHTPTGKVLKIDVERLLKFVNDHFGLDAVHEFIED